MANIIIIGILIVIVCLGLRSSLKHFKGEGGCCGGGSVPKQKKKKLKQVRERKLLSIEGMHCENCKNAVEKSINALSGAAANVSLEKKSATVELSGDVTDDELRQAVEQAGFHVTQIAVL